MAEKLYTGFSNYKEDNVEQRKDNLERELSLWGDKENAFKKYRNSWYRAAEEDFLPPHPLHVDIEISDMCNLRCKMCTHGMGTAKPSGVMTLEEIVFYLDKVKNAGAYSVKFNWRGEASLNKQLAAAVKYAKDIGILEVQLNTNGFSPHKNLLLETAKAGLDRMIFSVDGFSRETYESIRIGANYDQVINTILEIVDWKKLQGFTKPLVRVQMVRTNINAHEVKDFITYWQSKVDDVRISDVMDRGQGIIFNVGDQKTAGRRRCPQPFQRMIIARDGRVSPCCADWEQNYVIGDARSENLEDIWNGEKMTSLRKVQRDGTLDTFDLCRGCYVKESYIWEKVQ